MRGQLHCWKEAVDELPLQPWTLTEKELEYLLFLKKILLEELKGLQWLSLSLLQEPMVSREQRESAQEAHQPKALHVWQPP